MELKQHMDALMDRCVPLTDVKQELTAGCNTYDTRERNARKKFVAALKAGSCEAILSNIVDLPNTSAPMTASRALARRS